MVTKLERLREIALDQHGFITQVTWWQGIRIVTVPTAIAQGCWQSWRPAMSEHDPAKPPDQDSGGSSPQPSSPPLCNVRWTSTVLRCSC